VFSCSGWDRTPSRDADSPFSRIPNATLIVAIVNPVHTSGPPFRGFEEPIVGIRLPKFGNGGPIDRHPFAEIR